MPEDIQTIRILGIDFFNGSLDQALEFAHKKGGLILAPSGPGLAELGGNHYYDNALHQADLNLIDSGYLALLWKRKTGQALNRHSGYKFIKALVEDATFQGNHKQLWVMPSPAHTKATRDFLQREGLTLSRDNFYEAPLYPQGAVTDSVLLEKINVARPDYVILAIAGGKQEVLGHWLRDQIEYKPAILCIGAAIAFLSGQQANIPVWADRIYIGWFLRILSKPKTFIPRYWKARKLRKLLKHSMEQGSKR